jgi:hypothetical protein
MGRLCLNPKNEDRRSRDIDKEMRNATDEERKYDTGEDRRHD